MDHEGKRNRGWAGTGIGQPIPMFLDHQGGQESRWLEAQVLLSGILLRFQLCDVSSSK